jgi:hypothetical protein
MRGLDPRIHPRVHESNGLHRKPALAGLRTLCMPKSDKSDLDVKPGNDE